MAIPTNILSLCSGYGGIDLGLRIAEPSCRTVCFVEHEASVAAILAARFADGALDEAPIWSDLRSFDGKAWRGVVDIVTAGYPCQPFSCAGKQRGEKDPRHLWPEVARIVRECEPEWIFIENVIGHIKLGFREVAQELRQVGYGVKAGIFTAEEVGAPHLRRRLFALAHALRFERGFRQDNASGADSRQRAHVYTERSVGNYGNRIAGGCGQALAGQTFPPGPDDLRAWRKVIAIDPTLEPSICRDDDGTPERLHRLRALGNGVVPLVAAHAYQTLRSAFN